MARSMANPHQTADGLGSPDGHRGHGSHWLPTGAPLLGRTATRGLRRLGIARPGAARTGNGVVGGTARALRKLVGPTLGPDELAQAVSELSSRSHSAIARRHGVDRRRTPLLLGGALILSEVQRRLVVPLEVVGAGLREGALVRSLDAVAA